MATMFVFLFWFLLALGVLFPLCGALAYPVYRHLGGKLPFWRYMNGL